MYDFRAVSNMAAKLEWEVDGKEEVDMMERGTVSDGWMIRRGDR